MLKLASILTLWLAVIIRFDLFYCLSRLVVCGTMAAALLVAAFADRPFATALTT
jgi:hypothetical protein